MLFQDSFGRKNKVHKTLKLSNIVSLFLFRCFVTSRSHVCLQWPQQLAHIYIYIQLLYLL